MYSGHWFGFGGGIMWLFMIALIVLVVWSFRTTSGGPASGSNTSAQGPSALDVLQQRYARGEIDKTQFEQMRKDIS